MPIKIKLTPELKAELERFASEDGHQRGLFTDTSGNDRIERVSASSQATWRFKTEAGRPFHWSAPTNWDACSLEQLRQLAEHGSYSQRVIARRWLKDHHNEG